METGVIMGKKVRYLTFLILVLVPLCAACYVFVHWEQKFSTQRSFEESMRPLENVTFLLENRDGYQSVRPFYAAGEDCYYLFLPSYMEKGDKILLSLGQGELRLREEPEGEPVRYGNRQRIDMPAGEQNYAVTLTAGDGSVLEESRLLVKRSANLAAMFIETQSGSLKDIHEDKEYRESGRMTLVDETGKTVYGGDLSYIKGRGNVTWIYRNKKSYRIKLARKADLLDMGKSDSWVLLSNSFDGSYIRNAVMFDMAKEAGLAGTPDSAFTDLYINGQYVGLYQLTERIEVDEERVDVTKQSREPSDVTGGYLLEMEFIERMVEEPSGFVTKDGQAFVISDPSEASEEQIAYISGLMQEIETAILDSEDGVNPQTGRRLADMIDMDSWVKVHLIEEISGNQDAYLSSQYLYKDMDSLDGKVYAGPIWDFDVSSGNVECTNYKNPKSLSASLREIREGDIANHWLSVLYERAYFQEELIQTYEQTFLPILEETIGEKIDAYARLIGPAQKLDAIRWQAERGDWYWAKYDTFEGQVDYLKEFLTKKRDFLTSLWLEDEFYYVVRFKADELDYHDSYYYVKPGGTVQVPEVYWPGAAFEGFYDVETKEEVKGTLVIDRDRTFQGRWHELDDSASMNSAHYATPVGE